MQRVLQCFIVLQCVFRFVAVTCSLLCCAMSCTFCSELQCVAKCVVVCCSVLQCVVLCIPVCCMVRQSVVVPFRMPWE